MGLWHSYLGPLDDCLYGTWAGARMAVDMWLISTSLTSVEVLQKTKAMECLSRNRKTHILDLHDHGGGGDGDDDDDDVDNGDDGE